jgi:hypothetical protein
VHTTLTLTNVHNNVVFCENSYSPRMDKFSPKHVAVRSTWRHVVNKVHQYMNLSSICCVIVFTRRSNRIFLVNTKTHAHTQEAGRYQNTISCWQTPFSTSHITAVWMCNGRSPGPTVWLYYPYKFSFLFPIKNGSTLATWRQAPGPIQWIRTLSARVKVIGTWR